MIGPYAFKLFANPRAGTPGLVVLPDRGFRRARAAITGWTDYVPTPLHLLPTIATRAGVAKVGLKDEAGRFGLGSFKALGGAYAVAMLLANEFSRARTAPADITVTCATDGNHGRAVAWGAHRLGCRCVVFVHETVSQGRVDAIAAYDAEVRRLPGTYDDAVREADRVAHIENWFVVSDTSRPGYTEIPRDIMQGYRLMAEEAADQWQGAQPTHVFIQGGVGGVAAAVSAQMRARYRPVSKLPAPKIIVVEPDKAACLLASAELGAPTAVPGNLDTMMAGLACGEPSLLAWQELERGATAFMAVPDDAAIACMKLLAALGIVSGESGVAGLAGFLLAAGNPAARETLSLGPESRVLLFSTEGATDPALYARLIGPSTTPALP
ncbi:MAG: diaminopropionate ammonia-lyase [Acetobacteraceae bacterium]|nr:diaminopropionate ammonia-lyase [Acetobacteraceae bacterium]MSP29733.1 diaminopropionate ammonia-lyase [Acetobacteraceae bacterium]